MIIREEREKEQYSVNALVREAFLNAEHSTGRESKMLIDLRSSSSFVPQLSLVADIDNAIAGHALFLKAYVGKEPILVLALVSVAFSMRAHGAGGALIMAGQRIARKLGYNYIVVKGSNKYYPRLGYKLASTYGIEAPEGVDPAYYFALRLRDDAPMLDGKVDYPAEFEFV